MRNLRLDVQGFESLVRWRWVLYGPDGEFLADHRIRLNPDCWQYKAFSGLEDHLGLYVAPDRRGKDEEQIVIEVGEWAGEEIFGPVGQALAAVRSATVRVVLPPEAAPDHNAAAAFAQVASGRGTPCCPITSACRL